MSSYPSSRDLPRSQSRRRQGAALVALILPALLAGGCGETDPAAARANLHLPPDGYVANGERGRDAFARSCAECHGKDGLGTQRGPPLVNKTYEPGHHPDMAFHLAVKNGVRQHHWNFGDMPAQSAVTPKQAADIVRYVRELQRARGID